MTFPYDLELSYATPRRYGLSMGPSRLAKIPLSEPTLVPTASLSFIDAFRVPFALFKSLIQALLDSISGKLTLLYQDSPSWKSQQPKLYSQAMAQGSDRTALTDRDKAILNTLLHKVRCLTINQIGRTWWPDTKYSDHNAARRIRKLEQSGLVHTATIVCHAELEMFGPLLRWSPGEPEPDLGAISYRAQSRWTGEYRPTLAVIASKKASRLFGGSGGRYPRSSEETHDVHLASVYLHYLANHPNLALSWRHEDTNETIRGQKVPDALVTIVGRKVAVEFAGKYGKAKLRELHDHCEKAGMPYELW